MESNGKDTAAVNGTYVARSTSDTGSVDSVDTTSKTLTLNDSSANLFKVGDFLNLQAGSDNKVKKISRDGVTLTMTDSVDASATGTVSLVNSETNGLIAGTTNTSSGVTNLSTTVLPY